MKDIDKIALAGLLHDIGKFAQRAHAQGADIDISDIDFQLFCPKNQKGDFTHKHAGYTAKVLGDYIVEKQQDKKRIVKANTLDGKFTEISAKHHVPETDEQWIVAAADRLASGFEREVFEEYNHKVEEEVSKSFSEQQLDHLFNSDKKFKLSKFTPDNIFPTDEKGDGYKNLWEDFVKDLQKLYEYENYPEHLKVQALDYLLKKYTSFMPSATSFKFKNNKVIKPNIPLYEHLKTTSVFASAIASMSKENQKKVLDYYKNKKDTLDEKVFLIIAGDFFGIQNFIFDEVSTKFASKILRAKSAFIQILIKVLAYYVCEKLGVSYYSIISTHAGKFEILVPNEKEIIEKLKEIQKELNEFFMEEFFATTGVGVAFCEASVGDFILEGKYKNLRKKLADKVEEIKYKKFDLQNLGYKLFDIEKDLNNQNLCDFCHKRKGKNKEEYTICKSCERFVKIGQKLTKNRFIAITKKQNKDDIRIFKNYYLHFFDNPSKELAKDDIFIFDISKDTEFYGMEKWELQSYVATASILDKEEREYLNKNRDKELEENEVLTFEDLAKLSVREGINNAKREMGVEALMSLKGDADGMGNFIKDSDVTDSFAKYNFFAKMIDYYFSVYVPEKFMKNAPFYTVFAGGDDLFVLGAWDKTIDLAQKVRDDFVRFTDDKLTFSIGLIMSKANKPVNFLASVTEEALEKAKDYCCIYEKNECEDYDKCDEDRAVKKDALTLFNETMKWQKYEDVRKKFFEKFKHPKDEEFATTFLYRLIDLCEMSKKSKSDARATIWKSKLSYLYTRNISNKEFDLLNFLDEVINKYPKEFKTNLFEYIYKHRK